MPLANRHNILKYPGKHCCAAKLSNRSQWTKDEKQNPKRSKARRWIYDDVFCAREAARHFHAPNPRSIDHDAPSESTTVQDNENRLIMHG